MINILIMLPRPILKTFIFSFFEPGYIYYLFEQGAWAKLPYTFKNHKNACILIKVNQNELINKTFYIRQKLFSSSVTSLWRHYDVIINQFSINIGQTFKTYIFKTVQATKFAHISLESIYQAPNGNLL